MNKVQRQSKRNETARLVVIPDRRWHDCVRFNTGSTLKHEMFKALECFHLQEQGKSYICEARFENGSGRCDILNLDDAEAIEICVSEEEESIERKKKGYPVPIRVVRP